MARGIWQRPLMIGLPLAAAAGLSTWLTLAGFAKASTPLSLPGGAAIGAGLFTLVVVLALCARLRERRAGSAENKRYTHLLARMNAAEIEITQLKLRLEEAASSYQVEAAQRNQRLVNEMKLIENLVQQMAVRQPAPELPDFNGTQSVASRAAFSAAALKAAMSAEPEEPVAKPVAELSETELLEVIQSALEDNRIDLYLQPIVTLPQRKVARYEGLARLRSLDGEVIEPRQYEEVASAAGLMPIIDNLLLFRCVQIVRRLMMKSNRRGIIAQISSHSLLDSDFFPQFLEFMSENRALKDLLVFEFAHATLDLAGPEGENNLAALNALGFTFVLSGIDDLKLDLAWLKRQGFRHVKAPARLLGVLGADPTQDIAVDNFLTRLERQGMELIVDGIEDEAVVLDIIERNVRWGEGTLFGGPRPIKRDLLEGDGRSAA